MADTEQSMGEPEAKTPEVFDSGASSGSSRGAATDFTQVKPLSESDDPAHANFLPTEGHDTPDELISDREEGES